MPAVEHPGASIASPVPVGASRQRSGAVVRFATFEELRAGEQPFDPGALKRAERAEWQRLQHPVRREAWRLSRRLLRATLGECFNLRPALGNRPEGAELDSPGQRPGKTEVLSRQALKGRHKPVRCYAPSGLSLDGMHQHPRALPWAVEFDCVAVEIRSRDAAGKGVRPTAFLGGQPQPWRLSIAHTDRAACVAVSLDPGSRVGVDLVDLEDRAMSFSRLAAWFTSREQDRLDGAPHDAVSIVWALKEAVYKALNDGEPFRPRQIEILFADDGYEIFWHGRAVHDRLTIELRRSSGHILAIAMSPAGA